MKKAGMRLPNELVSQMTLDSLRRVGGGGWKRREEMASPIMCCCLVDICLPSAQSNCIVVACFANF